MSCPEVATPRREAPQPPRPSGTSGTRGWRAAGNTGFLFLPGHLKRCKPLIHAGLRKSLWWISYLACLITPVCHCTDSPPCTEGMHLPSQTPVPFIPGSWAPFWEGSQWNQLGFVQFQVHLNMISGTWAWLWVTTASAPAVLEHPSHCIAMKHQNSSSAWSCQVPGLWYTS